MTTSQLRADGRTPSQLRPISITRSWAGTGEGSALIECGNTRVLCVASLTEGVPRWKRRRLGHRRVLNASARHFRALSA